MFLIDITRNGANQTYYASSKKQIPSVVQKASNDSTLLVEEVIEAGTYIEINLKKTNFGTINDIDFRPLKDLVSVKCFLNKDKEKENE